MDIHEDTPVHKRGAWETAPRIPGNLQAEQALLGAVLISNNSIEHIPDLRPDHFFEPLHGDIFEAISAALLMGRVVTATTLADRFRNVEIDHATNGAQYLGRLISNATTIANVREYARTIIEAAQRRALIIVGEDMIARATDAADDASAAQIVEDAETALFRVSTRGQAGREVSISDATRSALAAAQKAQKRGGQLDGVPTGLADLDRQLGGGLGNSDLIVLGGRPSMGKTALATKIAINVARGVSPVTDADTGEVVDGKPVHVHFFSLEMTGEQLAARQLSELAGVRSDKLRRGDYVDHEARALLDAAAILDGASMTIEQAGGLGIASLSAMARREKRRNGTGLIVVDYLQLMQGSKRGGNRVQEITEITVGLKALAKELGVPILALSQLNRGLEKQEDKRPQMSDLRESGSIEQDADVVMFVYREEYYWLRKNPEPDADRDPISFAAWRGDYDKLGGIAEVIIGKQRHGPIGTVQLAFHGEFTRFSNLARGVR